MLSRHYRMNYREFNIPDRGQGKKVPPNRVLNMTKKSKKQSFGTGWVTTDDDERNIRRERARTEKMSVRFLGGGSVAPFGDYEVASEDGGLEKSYRVELRSLNAPVNSCSCPDFG